MAVDLAVFAQRLERHAHHFGVSNISEVEPDEPRVPVGEVRGHAVVGDVVVVQVAVGGLPEAVVDIGSSLVEEVFTGLVRPVDAGELERLRSERTHERRVFRLGDVENLEVAQECVDLRGDVVAPVTREEVEVVHALVLVVGVSFQRLVDDVGLHVREVDRVQGVVHVVNFEAARAVTPTALVGVDEDGAAVHRRHFDVVHAASVNRRQRADALDPLRVAHVVHLHARVASFTVAARVHERADVGVAVMHPNVRRRVRAHALAAPDERELVPPRALWTVTHHVEADIARRHERRTQVDRDATILKRDLVVRRGEAQEEQNRAYP